MLMKSLGLCLLAMATPYPAAPQTGSDMQKILDRLDKLETTSCSRKFTICASS
jgi:hypothetical protein